MSLSEKIGLDKNLWITYSKRISFLFYIIFIIILWSITEWFNFDILLVSLPFGLSCVGVIWILIFVLVLVFRAEKIPIGYREYDYLKRLAILIPVFTFILLFLLNQTFPIIQNSLNEDDMSIEETFEKYVEDNVKAIMYFDYDYQLGYKTIFYILNTGNRNIDEDLQINLAMPTNGSFSVFEDYEHLSFIGNETKPWIFSDSTHITIKWNSSLPTITLSKENSSRWAVIYFKQPWGNWEYISYPASFSIVIDDRHDVSIANMPIYKNPPEGNPNDWNPIEVLEIINDFYRYL